MLPPAASTRSYLPEKLTVTYLFVIQGSVLYTTSVMSHEKLILGAADGKSNNLLATELKTSCPTVLDWRRRFAEGGAKALDDDRPRGRSFKPLARAKTAEIITRTQSAPPQATQWSCSSVARACGVSTASVQRVWHANGLKPHLRLDIHCIADNYATHKKQEVKDWLATHPRFHLHFIPTSSSWLNLVERWFAKITTERIRRGVFTSVPKLERAIYDYIEHNNADPKPFVWAKSTNNIIRKVNRGREALKMPPLPHHA